METPPRSTTAACDPLIETLNKEPVPDAPYCRIGLFAVDVLNHKETVLLEVPVMPLYPPENP